MSDLTDSQIIIAITDSEKHVLAEIGVMTQRIKGNEDAIAALKELLNRVDKYHCDKETELVESIKTILVTHRWYKDAYMRVIALLIGISSLAVSGTFLIIKISEVIKNG